MDWNSRAREVINLVTYYYHQAEVSKMKGVLTDAECVEAQEKYKDQALSELASIVEEEIIGKDEIRDQHFGDNAVYFKDGAPERNAFRAKQRDQLSNRRKSDE